MKSVETKLMEEKKILEEIVSKAKNRSVGIRCGHLKIMKKRGRMEYYCDGKYLSKSEIDIAKSIAQRDYDESLVKNAEERIKAIEKFLKQYAKTSLKTLYQKINEYRKALIDASVISDEEFIKRWQAIEYEGKMYTDETQEIITERGERVRSKSEKIIADKLYSLGIPYRYEYPITLNGNIKLYPDFTILKMPEREEVYLEHFGMMDDSSYVDKVMFKLNTTKEMGYILG